MARRCRRDQEVLSLEQIAPLFLCCPVVFFLQNRLGTHERCSRDRCMEF